MSRWRLLTGTSIGSHTVPPRVVQPRRVVRQLDEVLEVGERAVAAPTGQIADERRAVRRRQHHVVAADLHRLRRVARQLGELARRGRAQRPHVTGVEVNGDAVDRGAGVAEQLQRLGVVADLDAHLGEHPVGLGLDQRQALLAEQLVRRDLAADERWRVRACALTGSGRHSCRPAAARAMACGRAGIGRRVATSWRCSSTSCVGRDDAADQVPVARIEHRRFGHVADTFDEPVASRMEHAPAGRIRRARNLALQRDAVVIVTVDARDRRQQGLGVRVVWSVEHVVGLADLHDAAEVHHRDAIGEVAHHTEVVADEHVTGALLDLQLGQQVEDGGLHRHVERAGRLVAHDDARVAGERAGDGDPLLQAARQLARLHVEVSW